MDPNLLYWKTEGQSFLSRLQTWTNLLDPTLLLASHPEIQKAHAAVGREGGVNKDDEAALTLSLSSVHADSGAALPYWFRPPAVFPITGPMVVAVLMPRSTVIPALFWQGLLQSYWAGFNFSNRNKSSEQDAKMSLAQLLLVSGTVSYTACAGALPQIFINRLRIKSPPIQYFCRSVLPIPLAATLAFLNVFTIRSEESEAGIQVFDSSGNPVGFSKAAGKKAVHETAISRAALLGTTAAVPHLLLLLLRRTRLLQGNRLLLAAPFHHVSVALVLGLMLPASFSLFPVLGTIQREKLEKELQAGAMDGPFFYHRGL